MKALARGLVEGHPDHLVEVLGTFEAGRAGLADEHPRPATHLHVTRGFELAIRRGDGVGMQAQAPGEGPHAGQPFPGSEVSPEDPQLELGHELASHGQPALPIEDDLHARSFGGEGVRGLSAQGPPGPNVQQPSGGAKPEGGPGTSDQADARVPWVSRKSSQRLHAPLP